MWPATLRWILLTSAQLYDNFQSFHGQPMPNTVPTVPHPPAIRPRVRARRGQATDPHSIAERVSFLNYYHIANCIFYRWWVACYAVVSSIQGKNEKFNPVVDCSLMFWVDKLENLISLVSLIVQKCLLLSCSFAALFTGSLPKKYDLILGGL